MVMLGVIVCFGGVLLAAFVAEWFWAHKILTSEGQRKFFHISVGVFGATWPWLTSWRAIQLVCLGLIAAGWLNRNLKLFHFGYNIKRLSYGEFYILLAVIACTLLTHNRLFYALAVLQVALADGLAALIGQKYGRRWRYKLFGQEKTVIGSMAFWFISLCILGAGAPFAHGVIGFKAYVLVLLFLPPLLTLIENFALFGLDNLALPVAALLVLQLAELI